MSRKCMLFASVVLLLTLESTGFGVVIGNFEGGSLDGFVQNGSSAIGTGTIGATLGSGSLVISPAVTGLDITLMKDIPPGRYDSLELDVTWDVSEWLPQDSSIWAAFYSIALNSVPPGFILYAPMDSINPSHPGVWDPTMGDQTRHLKFDISSYDASGATWMQLYFSINLGGPIITIGNFYIDNVRLNPLLLRVSTYAAANITDTSALLRGGLVEDGGSPCEGRFRYWIQGLKNQTEQTTSWQPITGPFSKFVTQLVPDTTYEYQIEARNADSTDLGYIRSLKTLPLVHTIVYVDATEGESGNTALATGEVFVSTEDDSGSDNLWRGRNFANGGTIFESGGQLGDTVNPEDCPRLCTSVDIDIPGSENDYAVYAYFWADGSPWRIQASLINDDNDLPLYFANDPNSEATQAVAEDFQEPVPVLAEGNRTLWQVFLGYTGPTSTITVYIDDDPNHQTPNARTWYDGIGYEVAPPRIHYMDATEGEGGNTTLATGEVFTSTEDDSGSDNLWRGRNFANEGTIFESGGQFGDTADPEDCPRLCTSVEVPEDIYAVYAYMWADGNPWRMQASLTNDDGDLPLYFANVPDSEATLTVTTDFEFPVPLLAEGNRTLWQIFLGYTDLTTTITVYIDDDPNHMTQNGRTWYDGIGYKSLELFDPNTDGL